MVVASDGAARRAVGRTGERLLQQKKPGPPPPALLVEFTRARDPRLTLEKFSIAQRPARAEDDPHYTKRLLRTYQHISRSRIALTHMVQRRWPLNHRHRCSSSHELQHGRTGAYTNYDLWSLARPRDLRLADPHCTSTQSEWLLRHRCAAALNASIVLLSRADWTWSIILRRDESDRQI